MPEPLLIARVGHGAFWDEAAGTSDPVGVLRYMLRTWALEPKFLGRMEPGETPYLFRGDTIAQNGEPIYPEHPTAVRFWGNFFGASCVFSVDTTDTALIAELTGLIAENMATPAFADALRQRSESEDYWAKRAAQRDRQRLQDRALMLRQELHQIEKGIEA
jgi:hypothetical protein